MKRLTAFGLSRTFRLVPIAPGGDDAMEMLRSRRDDFLLELAWDGHRVIACRSDSEVRLVSADLREWSETFPTVTRAIQKLPAKTVALEGFLCALDDSMRPSFELLRAHAEGRARPRVMLALSDLLHLDGEDLRPRALTERRAALTTLVTGVGAPLALSGALEGPLEQVLASARSLGVPGVIARSTDATFALQTTVEKRRLSPPPKVTNATKVMYPRDGFTKSDVVAFYDHVSEVMLPHLRDRPVVCQRWPDGIDDFTWYQHRLPPKAPDYLRGVMIEGNRRILIDDRDGLLWMVNQAALTFHGWASRVGRLEQPDWVILDLDPGESTTWADTIQVALAVRKLLELLELPSVPKTSGKKGLHVLVPIGAGHSVQDAHEVARRAAKAIAQALPATVSLENAKDKRRGRLFLDHLQSFVGKSLVMPYSLRDADGATVSAPLSWSEVVPTLDPKSFNLRTMSARLERVGDLAKSLLAPEAKLAHALARLVP
ncbi:MAG: non-homologous end-joining DNA ligase [Polyangiales bacterium]